MRHTVRVEAVLTVLASMFAPGGLLAAQEAVAFSAADHQTVHASWYRAVGDRVAVILAFHQAGASGSGEYGPIAPRLAAAGYDVLAVDLRAGGELFGGHNRTVEARGGSSGYCEAAPDLAAALRYARDDASGVPIVLWGSSYSAALVLRLAVGDPDGVAGVLAFSPASGGPMSACRAEEVSDRITVPVLALRPRAEMQVESAAAQFEAFAEQGHETFVADPGAHGSSMLVEDRVDGPVEETWEVVLRFLDRALSAWQRERRSGPVKTVSIEGLILDGVTRGPVAGAVIRHLASGSAAVADATGRFTLELEPAGAYVLQIEQLGYEASQAVLPSTAPIEASTVLVRPKPIELEELLVTVTGQLEVRRVRSARPVDVLDQVAIADLGGYGPELLRRAMPLTRLCFDASGELCFIGRRGRKEMVSICIDERPAYGGVDDLTYLEPWDLHSIELFERGRHVRVYTRAFMAKLMAQGRRLRPLDWCR